MNEFLELEAELKKLRPAAASAELSARIEQSLGERTATAGVLPPSPKRRPIWFALGLGFAAAAVLVLARMNVDRAPRRAPAVAVNAPSAAPSNSQPARNLVPDELTRVVYHTSDEGLVFPNDSAAPLRRVRSQSRETLRWKDERTGASLRVSYPTDEVEFIPISTQ